MMRRFEIHRNDVFVGEGVMFEGDDALVVTNVKTGPYSRVTRRTLGDLEDWLRRTNGVLVWIDPPPLTEQEAEALAEICTIANPQECHRPAPWPLDFY